MSKLVILRSRLASLRRRRWMVRTSAAYSALLIGLLWSLAAVFLIDFVFEMDVVQRLIVMALGVVASGWVFRRYTLPMLGRAETNTDMALLVEREHRIDSDLVAALQFESPQASGWGSRQLEDAVIEKVASIGRGLNVFAGFSPAPMMSRAAMLLATVVVLVGLALAFPRHAAVFFERLALGGQHYPSMTKIDQVLINGQTVLLRGEHGTLPIAANSPEGQPVRFLIQCSGRLPTTGRATLRSPNGQKRPLEVQLLSLERRRASLADAASRISDAIDDANVATDGPWRNKIAAMLWLDAPAAAKWIDEGDARSGLDSAVAEIENVLAQWPGKAQRTAVFDGRLARLVEPVSYQLYLGDAWTDSAAIDMTPLPIVEPRFNPRPPKYAATANSDPMDPGARQLSVLEGSAVDIAIQCTNNKTLTAAWLSLKTADEPRRFELARDDQDGKHWHLPIENTPFEFVQRELRFEIQVTDEHGLHLETPIRGYIRIKADRPPICSAGIVHRVVLPTAKPVIEYRANDDYGIASLVLHAQIERYERPGEILDEGDEGPERVDERQSFPILAVSPPATAERMPLSGQFEMDLASLDLMKGDRLKLTMEATDYRGDADGQTYLSDPLLLEISDESGVLAAVGKADENAEEQLGRVLDQQFEVLGKELGLDEAPE